MKSKPIETSEALDKALEEIKKCEEKEQMNDEMNDKMSDEMNNEVNNMDEMNEQELNDFFGDDTDSFTDTQRSILFPWWRLPSCIPVRIWSSLRCRYCTKLLPAKALHPLPCDER